MAFSSPYGYNNMMPQNMYPQNMMPQQQAPWQQQPQQPQYPSYPQVQPPTRTVLPGRLVNNLEEISASDVPMDGNVSLFPKNDYSCVFAKAWNSDGSIRTVKYIPEVEKQAVPVPDAIVAEGSNMSEEILRRLDAIEKALTEKNPAQIQPQATKVKKGDVGNE